MTDSRSATISVSDLVIECTDKLCAEMANKSKTQNPRIHFVRGFLR